MIEILHISDPHGDDETMERISNLAKLCASDVVAHTGDCYSYRNPTAPEGWNAWPQIGKFSVPGNHDFPETFDLLRTWQHRAPWVFPFEDLIFVGLDSERVTSSERYVASIDFSKSRAVVLMTHKPPTVAILDMLLSAIGPRTLLVLHGHEHPTGLSGVEWADSATHNSKPYIRSKVCSSISGRLGLGHLVVWDGTSFTCKSVQGPKGQGPIVRHPKFGNGLLVKREGDGEEAKLTVEFLRVGTKLVKERFVTIDRAAPF